MAKKLEVFVFLILAIYLLFMPNFHEQVTDKKLHEYKKAQFIAKSVQVKAFETTSRGRTSLYYELEFLLPDSTRYFFRSPYKDEISDLRAAVHSKRVVSLHHLNELERNGGQRIINLVQDGKTIIDIHYLLDEQNKKNIIGRVLGFILLSIFVLYPLLKYYLPNIIKPS
jgi:hypothetical protein